jgi:hypothetical protein
MLIMNCCGALWDAAEAVWADALCAAMSAVPITLCLISSRRDGVIRSFFPFHLLEAMFPNPRHHRVQENSCYAFPNRSGQVRECELRPVKSRGCWRVGVTVIVPLSTTFCL